MVNIIKAEHQKAKRTMRKKFIWGFPLLTFVMAFIFTLGMTNAYAESVWNWWYTLLLPGMIALFCYLSVAQEKKIKYYHLMTIPTDRRKLLLGKIIYIGYMILFSNVIVFAGATLGGFLLTTHVPVFYQMDLPQKQGILFWIRESLFRECVSQSSGLFL